MGRVRAKPKRADNRREALLKAASAIFLEQGYTATSIDSIIERAGGSKRNIYSEFGGKEELFSALIVQSAEQVVSSLTIEQIAGRDLRETLTTFGFGLMQGYMSPALIKIFRVIVTEANQFPEIVKSFYSRGPGQATHKLVEILEDAKARGEIEHPDCNRLAGHFVGMIRDNLHLQVVLGLCAPPSVREAKETVASAVDVFLNGVAASRPATR